MKNSSDFVEERNSNYINIFINLFTKLLLLVAFVVFGVAKAQVFEPGNKIRLEVRSIITKESADQFSYEYSVRSRAESEQSVWIFKIIFDVQPDSVARLFSVQGWWAPVIPVEAPRFWVSYGAPENVRISPGQVKRGFGLTIVSIPGITDYYAEGYAPPPAWQGSVAEDTIPGYDDLTPYGPGIVGKTVGPVLPPDPFMPLSFLDTLLSYARQSAQLGWLGRIRDDDCDEDERPDDGVVRNIENRLQKARRELVRGDSVKARRELVKLVRKVDRLQRRGERVMTSEAYALLKYNTEYVIERLPERRRR